MWFSHIIELAPHIIAALAFSSVFLHLCSLLSAMSDGADGPPPSLAELVAAHRRQMSGASRNPREVETWTLAAMRAQRDANVGNAVNRTAYYSRAASADPQPAASAELAAALADPPPAASAGPPPTASAEAAAAASAGLPPAASAEAAAASAGDTKSAASADPPSAASAGSADTSSEPPKKKIALAQAASADTLIEELDVFFEDSQIRDPSEE